MTEKLTRLVRELNAAKNHFCRCQKDLSDSLEDGLVILHRLPEEPDGPETLYWTYSSERGVIFMGVHNPERKQVKGFIIVAPGPSEEESLNLI